MTISVSLVLLRFTCTEFEKLLYSTISNANLVLYIIQLYESPFHLELVCLQKNSFKVVRALQSIWVNKRQKALHSYFLRNRGKVVKGAKTELTNCLKFTKTCDGANKTNFEVWYFGFCCAATTNRKKSHCRPALQKLRVHLCFWYFINDSLIFCLFRRVLICLRLRHVINYFQTLLQLPRNFVHTWNRTGIFNFEQNSNELEKSLRFQVFI